MSLLGHCLRPRSSTPLATLLGAMVAVCGCSMSSSTRLGDRVPTLNDQDRLAHSTKAQLQPNDVQFAGYSGNQPSELEWSSRHVVVTESQQLNLTPTTDSLDSQSQLGPIEARNSSIENEERHSITAVQPVSQLVEQPDIQPMAATLLPPEHYVALGLDSNPKLSALRHRIAALRNRIPQVRSLPDPTLQETFWPFNGNALETAGGRSANQIGLSQAIPWPEKLRAKSRIACREVQMAEAELEKAQLQIAESIRLACLDIWLANEALKVVDGFGDLVKQLNQVAEAKYASGQKDFSQQDILRAQLEGDRLEDRQVQWLNQKRVAQAELAAQVHQPDMVGAEIDLSFPAQDLNAQLDELIGLAMSCNPAFRGLFAQIARDREKQKLACLQKYPDFQLGASWLMVSDNNALSPVATGNDVFGFTVGMTLPVWQDKIRAGVAEAHHQTQSSSGLLESEKDSVAGNLRRLISQFDTFTQQRKILEERIIPRTQDALEISLIDYAGNRADFSSLIANYQERLMLELQLLKLKRGQQGTLIQIERIVGCDGLTFATTQQLGNTAN